jgi:hypothetical protein
MNKEIFTAGTEAGGLTSGYEVRLLVCWLLSKLDTELTRNRLINILSLNGLINYFELVRAIDQLITSSHITKKTDSETSEDILSISQLGKDTAKTFEKDIPYTVREKTFKFAHTFLMRERHEKENMFAIEELQKGFMVHMGVSDVEGDLLRLQLFVPTLDLCNDIREHFLGDPSRVYRCIAEVLTGQDMNTVQDNLDEQMRLDV